MVIIIILIMMDNGFHYKQEIDSSPHAVAVSLSAIHHTALADIVLAVS